MTALLLLQGAAEIERSAADARWRLFGDYSLADPWFLLLIPVGLLLVLHGRSRRARVAGRVPVLPGRALPRSLRQRTAWVPDFLRAIAVCLAVIAAARPLRGNVQQQTVSEGVDIALVIDRSGSMVFNDLDPEATRLDVVKDVVEDFAVRRMTDREGNADNVCLITFAYYPRLLCPFTLDVDALRNFLRPVEIVDNKQEDGTSIGVALAKAVSVLKDTEAKSKVAVLLTDGENIFDDIPPADAAELAAAEGIRVHTVLAARYVYKRDIFGGGARPTDEEPNTEELEAIAEITGGRFFRARDREGLEEIYAEIERMERTPREEKRFTESFDLYPLFLQPAIGLYLVAWIAGATFARRVS